MRWGVAGALLASLCCAGPLVAVLIAGGTAAGTVGLVRYKLEFIAVGLVITLLGIGLSLRKSKACCSITVYRRNRILIPVISLLTFALLVAGSNLLLLNDRVIDAASGRLGRDARPGAGAPQPPAPQIRQLDVAITSGVYCPACLLAIQKRLIDTPGVQTVSFSSGTDGVYVAHIVYDPARVSQPVLLTAIAQAPGSITGTYGTNVLREGPA
jgi:hypothetical protein